MQVNIGSPFNNELKEEIIQNELQEYEGYYYIDNENISDGYDVSPPIQVRVFTYC